MSKAWQLQEAKNRLSEVVDKAISQGPQIVSRRGKEAVIILSIEDYRKMNKTQKDLVEFFRKSPLYGLDLDINRSSDLPRKIKL